MTTAAMADVIPPLQLGGPRPATIDGVITGNDTMHPCAQGTCSAAQGRVGDGVDPRNRFNADIQSLDVAALMKNLDDVHESVSKSAQNLRTAIDQNEYLVATRIGINPNAVTRTTFNAALQARRAKPQLTRSIARWVDTTSAAIGALRRNLNAYQEAANTVANMFQSNVANIRWLMPDVSQMASQTISKATSIGSLLTRLTTQTERIRSGWSRLQTILTEARAGRLILGPKDVFDVRTIRDTYVDLLPDTSALDAVIAQMAAVINATAIDFKLTTQPVTKITALDADEAYRRIMTGHNEYIVRSIESARDSMLATEATRAVRQGFIDYLEKNLRSSADYAATRDILARMETENSPEAYITRMRLAGADPNRQIFVISALNRALENLSPEDEIYRQSMTTLRDATVASVTGRLNAGGDGGMDQN